MKKLIVMGLTAVLGLGAAAAGWYGTSRPAEAAPRDRDSADEKKPDYGYSTRDYYPDLKKKIVPIISVGSSLNVGAAQVAGEEKDVDRVKVVAQLETDYKDIARIKILVPVQSEDVVKHIDRVPGVSVTALADYAIKK